MRRYRMTGKTFMNAVGNGKTDILQIFLGILEKTRSAYCIIGGLAVNAYVEPVISLDLDMIVAMEDVEDVCKAAKRKGLRVEKFEHRVNLTSAKSDLRVQLQADVRYQGFIFRSRTKQVLGYRMKVANIEDVLQGKIWAFMDEQRRRSKRQKDLADIMRLVEAYPELKGRIPSAVKRELKLK
jgi:hypothetical protein